ncbi:unnamed protein product [Larinioides sclopetarius]|uniref:Integrase catalytic domain-containing protein n=1 Tax=Larinioides sclopetarius TaxID=280406 RepID=A0AAV1Z007_9ARAC
MQQYLKALKIDIPCFYWTDSKITYFWIRGSPGKFKPFVKNRVEEIHKLSTPSNWHHCPGAANPADLVSRGVKISKLINNELWLFGPEWLSRPPEFWPKPQNKEEIDVSELEYNKKSKEVLQNQCIIDELKNPIDICKYSNLKKLVRVTAWVKRFITNLKNSVKNRNPLTTEEVIDAENFLIRIEQKHFFKEEYEALKNNNSIKKDSSLLSYMPYLDENELLRLGGRLEFCDLTVDEKHPIILPRNSWLTTLIIRREHGKVMHGGIASTLTKIRSNYWIPKGRQLVKRVIKSCIICRKYLAKPADQLTAPLPSDRTHQTPVFSVCGLDFAGPLYVKNCGELKKSYIVLFTCGVTRALHLELVSSMTTDSFLLAFRRFLARRGNCKIIYSDNAKTFMKGKKEIENLSTILSNSTVKDYVSKEKIVWKNIIERSPWWGGFYERLVKSVKECLHKILGRALLNFEEMSTVLTEIEAVLNLRPLSYVYGESDNQNPSRLCIL